MIAHESEPATQPTEELAAMPPDVEPDATHSPAPFADDEPGSAMRETS